MSRYSDSSLMSGLGLHRRRRRVGRPRGRGLADLLGGMRHRRVHHRRHVRGRGIFDIIKGALPFVKKSGILGHLAGMIPGVGGLAGTAVKALGYGRRRRRVVHRRRHVGGMTALRRAIIRHAGARRHVRHRVSHRRHGRGLLL